jgi:hypothetical protein
MSIKDLSDCDMITPVRSKNRGEKTSASHEYTRDTEEVKDNWAE